MKRHIVRHRQQFCYWKTHMYIEFWGLWLKTVACGPWKWGNHRFAIWIVPLPYPESSGSASFLMVEERHYSLYLWPSPNTIFQRYNAHSQHNSQSASLLPWPFRSLNLSYIEYEWLWQKSWLTLTLEAFVYSYSMYIQLLVSIDIP